MGGSGYPLIKLYDGVLQLGTGGGGGGVTEQRVKEIMASARPGIVVEVSPSYIASDLWNQYPTIAEGLARADVLVAATPGLIVEVWVRNAIYPEELLPVNDNVVLNMEPGSVAVGVTGDTILVFNGTGRCGRVYVQPALAGIGNPVIISKENHNTFLMEELSILNLQSGYSAEIEFEKLTGSRLFTFWHTIKGIGSSPIGLLITDSSEARIDQCSIFQLGATAVKCIDTGVPYFYDAITFFNSTLVSAGSSLDLGRNSRALLYNTFVEIEKVVFDPATPFAERYDLVTQGAPQASSMGTSARASIETVEDLLLWLYGESVIADKRLDDDQNNIAILITRTAADDLMKSGDYTGLFAEDFADAAGIASSEGVILPANDGGVAGAVVFGGIGQVDNFEGYADTAALQAAWARSDTGMQRTLATDGLTGQTKCMNISVSSSSASNDYVSKTYPSPYLDLMSLRSVRFSLKGGDGVFTPGGEETPVRIRLVDAAGVVATSPYIYFQSAAWNGYEFFFTNFTAGGGFRWDRINVVSIQLGTVPSFPSGSFEIDGIFCQLDEFFTQDGLITNCDSVGEIAKWAADSPNQTLSRNTSVQWGTGASCLQLVLQDFFAISYTPTAPFSIDPTVTSAIRFKARFLNAPIGAPRIGVRLFDGSGNYVTMPCTFVGHDVLPSKVGFVQGFKETRWHNLVGLLSDAYPADAWPGTFDYSNIVKVSLVNLGSYPFLAVSNTMYFDYFEFGRVANLVSVQLDPALDWDIEEALMHATYTELEKTKFKVESSLEVGAVPYFNLGFPRSVRKSSIHGGYGSEALSSVGPPWGVQAGNGFDLQSPQSVGWMRTRVTARAWLTLYGYSVFWR